MENQGKRKWVFRGITEDAEELGVSRQHLWFVLTGKRESKSLSRRYRALKAQQRREAVAS